MKSICIIIARKTFTHPNYVFRWLIVHTDMFEILWDKHYEDEEDAGFGSRFECKSPPRTECCYSFSQNLKSQPSYPNEYLFIYLWMVFQFVWYNSYGVRDFLSPGANILILKIGTLIAFSPTPIGRCSNLNGTKDGVCYFIQNRHYIVTGFQNVKTHMVIHF